MSKELNFDEWYCLHEDEINIELAENRSKQRNGL